MSRSRRFLPLLVGLALVAGACTQPAPTQPSPRQQSLDRATDWLLAQFDASGALPNEWDPAQPDIGHGVLAAADLAALGKGAARAPARLANLEANYEDYVDEGAGDRPGALARVIMAAVAGGADPRDFGGSDLVARLEATLQPSGRFGAQSAAFDGAFRQGLALAALSIVTPRPASITPGPGQTIDDLPAVSWLQDQQCDDGSWLMFRASTVTDCMENPAMWTYKDSNGTALAILGLEAVGADADVSPLGWINAVRGNDGGWGTSPSGPTQISDADSTGLVIAALKALGVTPDAAAYTALIAFQLGVSAPVADRGAFVWQLPSTSPNRLATLDGIVGLFNGVWPAVLIE